MKTIKRILKRWLGINYLIDLCDERDKDLHKILGEERERYNKLFHANKFAISNAVKTYDKMLDDINDRIDNIDYVNNSDVNNLINKRLKESPYDKDGMFKDEEYKKNEHFKECLILKIDALLKYINLNN